MLEHLTYLVKNEFHFKKEMEFLIVDWGIINLLRDILVPNRLRKYQ